MSKSRNEMAEAAVEERRYPPRYFCRLCMREVQPNFPDLTCSRCNRIFVEVVRSRPAHLPLSSADLHSTHSAIPLDDLLRMRTALSELCRVTGRTSHYELLRITDVRDRYNAHSSVRNDDADSEDNEMLGVAPSASFNFNSGAPQQLGQQTFHGSLHANPGDYAWGLSGLDTIISQLSNRQEETGAPPAQKDRINSLPRVSIEQTHVDNTIQCSICTDDFELAMEARKLPCDHLYHSECIVKWLEMRQSKRDVDFYKNWNEYRNGFGDLNMDFWIGNDIIHALYQEGYSELSIEMIYQGRRIYAHYSNFYVAREAMNYLLTVGGYKGTATDSLTYHNNMYFSTFDRDNDKDPYNC